jgi:hypothetical protein
MNYAKSCKYNLYKTTAGTVQGEIDIDMIDMCTMVYYGALSWLEPLQRTDKKQ